MEKNKCFFLPTEKLEKFIKLASAKSEHNLKYGPGSFTHKKDLLKLKIKKSVRCISLTETAITSKLVNAIRKALLANDWNRLHFLLTSWPLCDSKNLFQTHSAILRAYMLLLLHHPHARANSLIMDFCHMVIGCRNDDEKRAFMKLLVTLPPELIQGGNKNKIK